MPSFLDKLRAGGVTTSTTSGSGKKDGKDANVTWLQKLQQDPDPVQTDGSDKFFGAENFGNTCYFNSMVQSLYYSVPFRELVLSYPARSDISSVLNDADGNPRKIIKDSQANGQAVSSAKKPATSTPNTPQKPEDKDSPDYKKKQAMLNGPVLNIDYDNATTYGMSPSLFTCLKDAFEAVIATNTRTGVLSMTRFLETLRQDNDMFRSPMHQDAHEFLNILLNGVIEGVEQHTKELEKATDASGAVGDVENKNTALITAEESKRRHKEFQKLFLGTLTSETKCLTCENVSQRDEPFLDLSMDLEQHSSVTSCLRQFSQEEMLREQDKFFCDKCGGLQEAEKRMKIKRAPRILALHLKRFKYTEDLQRLQKLFHRVVYPYHLRLFNTTDESEDPDKLYELYAVVVHIGSGPYHGHYVAIIKTPARGWLLFDDEMVEPVDKSFVKNFFGAQIGMACAYVLFYQETTLEAVKKEQEEEGLAAEAAAAEANQPPVKEAKESYGLLGLKINGLTPTPVSPGRNSHEDDAPRLAQVVSAPAAAQTSSETPLSPHILPAPQPVALSPNGVAPAGTPIVVPTKAEKKQAAKEEKERKAAEKEREKVEKAAEKARRKSMESRSKTQAANIRQTIITGIKPDTSSSVGSGSGDGAATSTAPSTNGLTAITPPMPQPPLPTTATTPTIMSSVPDGDEIAPAPLPSASQPVDAKPYLTPTLQSTPSKPPSTIDSSAAGSQPTSSPKPDSGSNWGKPAFNSFSLRRSSKSQNSPGKKPKLWDRFGASDSTSSTKAGGSGALVAPTSNPASNAPTSHPATHFATPAAPSPATATGASASAPASALPTPNLPPLPPQRADDVAVEDTDSGTEAEPLLRPPPVPPKDPVRVRAPLGAPLPGSSVDARTGLGLGTDPGAAAAAGAARAAAGPEPRSAGQNVPPPWEVSTEASGAGLGVGLSGTGSVKRRGFSSIRKKASNLLS